MSIIYIHIYITIRWNRDDVRKINTTDNGEATKSERQAKSKIVDEVFLDGGLPNPGAEPGKKSHRPVRFDLQGRQPVHLDGVKFTRSTTVKRREELKAKDEKDEGKKIETINYSVPRPDSGNRLSIPDRAHPERERRRKRQLLPSNCYWIHFTATPDRDERSGFSHAYVILLRRLTETGGGQFTSRSKTDFKCKQTAIMTLVGQDSRRKLRKKNAIAVKLRREITPHLDQEEGENFCLWISTESTS